MASNDAAQRESYLATVKTFMIPPSASQIPIIDSHIHLYPASEQHTLAWLSPKAPKELQGQHSVEDYLVATEAPSSLRGFVFLETDRIEDLATGLADGSGYKHPLAEVSFLSRVALGTPREGEGHTAAHAPLCLAIIPWAPLPSGPSALEEYIGLVKSAAGKAFSKIKGFRYLVQDKPMDTMLGDGFIEGLQYLGKKGYVFDLGVDSHNGGEWQLGQAVEMIGRAHDGVSEEEKVGIVINHLCKPDLTSSGDVTTDPKFIAWRESIFQLSLYSKTYMKLSGMLSELPPDLQNASGDEIFGKIVPWLIVILTAFKPHRIMFGSDWPVCEANIGGEAWTKWAWIVERFCDVAGLGDVEKGMVWGGTASKAYGIYGDVAEKVREEEEEDEDDEDEEGEDEDESEEEQKIPAARGTAARLRAASKAMP